MADTHIDNKSRNGLFPNGVEVRPYDNGSGGLKTAADLPLNPIGYHAQANNFSTAKSIPVPDGAYQMIIQTQTKNIRLTLDGITDPTTTKGFLIVADAAPVIIPVNPGKPVKIIEVAATAVVDYQFGA